MEQLKKYKEQQDEEDMEIINSIFESMEALGDEFKEYLKEAGEDIEIKKEEEQEKEKPMNIFTPFTSVFKGFGEIFGALVPKKKKKEGKTMITKGEEAIEKSIAKKEAAKLAFMSYDVFKKSHGMMAW